MERPDFFTLNNGEKVKLPFSKSEYDRRVNNLRTVMDQNNLDMVILGHSERRELYNETNDIVKLKSKNALKNNLKVIICVGESLSQRKNGKTLRVIGEQLKKSLPE